MGARLEVRDGRIVVRAPREIPPEFLEKLRRHKKSVLRLLLRRPTPDVYDRLVRHLWTCATCRAGGLMCTRGWGLFKAFHEAWQRAAQWGWLLPEGYTPPLLPDCPTVRRLFGLAREVRAGGGGGRLKTPASPPITLERVVEAFGARTLRLIPPTPPVAVDGDAWGILRRLSWEMELGLSVLGLARGKGWPRLEIRPGETIQGGWESWEKFLSYASLIDLRAALKALGASVEG